MAIPPSIPDNQPLAGSDFERAAAGSDPGLIAEFALFLREHKAWWMIPILLSLTLIGAAVWLSTTSIAPFIYPLF